MKRILIIIFCAFISSTAFSSNDSDSLMDKSTLRDSIVDYAQEFIGIPYVWGGSSTKGFDCTGFVYYVFKKFGIKVSRASSGYEGKGEEVDLGKARAGDIMLFTGTNPQIRKVGHAGIVLKNEDGVVDFIHSSSSKKHFGVTITRYNESGYVKRFLKTINVIQ
ncbi:MAG: C40 family peptidase [Crocinitomicaceae bacterium]